MRWTCHVCGMLKCSPCNFLYAHFCFPCLFRLVFQSSNSSCSLVKTKLCTSCSTTTPELNLPTSRGVSGTWVSLCICHWQVVSRYLHDALEEPPGPIRTEGPTYHYQISLRWLSLVLPKPRVLAETSDAAPSSFKWPPEMYCNNRCLAFSFKTQFRAPRLRFVQDAFRRP